MAPISVAEGRSSRARGSQKLGTTTPSSAGGVLFLRHAEAGTAARNKSRKERQKAQDRSPLHASASSVEPRAFSVPIESEWRPYVFVVHDLVRKPVTTFRDHAQDRIVAGSPLNGKGADTERSGLARRRGATIARSGDGAAWRAARRRRGERRPGHLCRVSDRAWRLRSSSPSGFTCSAFFSSSPAGSATGWTARWRGTRKRPTAAASSTSCSTSPSTAASRSPSSSPTRRRTGLPGRRSSCRSTSTAPPSSPSPSSRRSASSPATHAGRNRSTSPPGWPRRRRRSRSSACSACSPARSRLLAYVFAALTLVTAAARIALAVEVFR